jgi:hypothetical protein
MMIATSPLDSLFKLEVAKDPAISFPMKAESSHVYLIFQDENRSIYKVDNHISRGVDFWSSEKKEHEKHWDNAPIFTVEDGSINYYLDDGNKFFTIDLNTLVEYEDKALSKVLTAPRNFHYTLVEFTAEGVESELIHLTNDDQRAAGAEQCSSETTWNKEKFQCGRQADHIGTHQSFTTHHSITWDESRYPDGDRNAAFGPLTICENCGIGMQLESQGYQNTCFTCHFWAEKRDYAGKKFVIDGRHYIPGSGGFGGRKFTVDAFDGSTWTGELFTQGKIPEHFKATMPDTAVFRKEG